MRKISKAVFFYLSLILISLVIQSCCNSEYIINGDGELRAYQLDYTQIDTIDSEFLLISYFASEVIGMNNDFSIIPTSYATSCDYAFSNSLDKSTAELTLDKDIVFDNETITAGTNIISSTGITFDNGASYGAEMEIKFTQEFLDKVVFQKESYIFKVNISTDDGVELEHELSLEMNL